MVVNCEPIRIEDLGLAEPAYGLLYCLDAEVSLHRDGQPPAQSPPAEPVYDGGKIDKAAGHRDVGDVHRPDLIGPRHRQR